MRILLKILALLLVFLMSCEDKLNLTELNELGKGPINFSDTLYIRQSPDWTGYNNPQDMIVGREPFIYVADTDNDRIVMLNIAGEVLGTRSIKRPVALAQDYKLNLIVCAEFDTVINSVPVTFSAVYKLNLVEVNHQIENTKLERILPRDPKDDPFAFTRPDREYTGVCVFYDNSIYVSRKGPNNSNPIDWDNAILTLKFVQTNQGKDSLVLGKVPLLEPEGTGLMSANRISSLTSFNKRNLDVILTLTGNNSFKVQWLKYVQTPDFSGYQPRFDAFSNDLMQVGKFGQPEDVALDGANNIFVADAAKDSVFKFSSFGDELQSFGGADLLNSPHAVAYHDKTVYVLDTGNNRILRFILSTEVE